jgi:two-component system, OmpR family, response regulator
MRILIVEDDPRVAEQAQRTLVAAGFVVDLAHDGEEGHFLGDTEPYDAVVLDLGLPMLDGLSVLQRWRQEGRTMPVLILTARGTWREKSWACARAPTTTSPSRSRWRRCWPGSRR